MTDFTLTFHFRALEKEMETHFSVLAWKIPGMAGPGGLPSMGSHRVGYDLDIICWILYVTSEHIFLHKRVYSSTFIK